MHGGKIIENNSKKSQINYSYTTIKVTQSRINKGLIAIPVTLANWFPGHNDTIQVYLMIHPFLKLNITHPITAVHANVELEE